MTDGTTKRGRGRPKTFDRDRALAVAIDSYWRDGVVEVSVNEICRRADISKPGLYREFGGEDDLMVAALDHYVDTVLAGAFDMLASSAPFDSTLDALIASNIQPRQDGAPSGCLAVKMRTHCQQLGERTRARVDALSEEIRVGYEDFLRRAVEREEVTLTVPVEVAASYLDAQLVYLNELAARETPELVRAHADLAFAVFRSPTSDATPTALARPARNDSAQRLEE